MTAVAVTASGLPAVLAAVLEARGDVPPPSPCVSSGADPEESRPAPTAVGTGLAHSFEETVPSEEEAHSA